MKQTNNLKYSRYLVLNLVLALILLAIFLYLTNQLLSKLLWQQIRVNPNNITNQYDPLARRGVYFNQVVDLPTGNDFWERDNYILGVSKSKKAKTIRVNLSTQRVYAYEGKKMVYDFLISSGLWGRTPTGKFKIWAKVRYQKMEGGFGPTYYNLPNVPYVMFFYNTEVSQSAGFSFHGTYWHDNFGHPMSHGCINMRTEDAALLYYWANPDLAGLESTYASEKNPGTTVEIYGQAPES